MFIYFYLSYFTLNVLSCLILFLGKLFGLLKSFKNVKEYKEGQRQGSTVENCVCKTKTKENKTK